MAEYIGFSGDAYIVNSSNEPLTSYPRTMTIMSFTSASDPYNHPENVVIDTVYAYKNGTMNVYNIANTTVTYENEVFSILVDDGSTYITLWQEYASEFGTILQTSSNRGSSPRETTYILGFSVDSFNISQYVNNSAYFFFNIGSTPNYNNLTGFAIIPNANETSYTYHNMTQVTVNNDMTYWSGMIDGRSFTANTSEFFPGFNGTVYYDQFDSMTGFERWFQITSHVSSWIWFGIIVAIIIVIILMGWSMGWFAAKK